MVEFGPKLMPVVALRVCVYCQPKLLLLRACFLYCLQRFILNKSLIVIVNQCFNF